MLRNLAFSDPDNGFVRPESHGRALPTPRLFRGRLLKLLQSPNIQCAKRIDPIHALAQRQRHRELLWRRIWDHKLVKVNVQVSWTMTAGGRARVEETSWPCFERNKEMKAGTSTKTDAFTLAEMIDRDGGCHNHSCRHRNRSSRFAKEFYRGGQLFCNATCNRSASWTTSLEM